jgi:hypothetical protein
MEKYNAESLFKMVTELVAEVTIGKRAEDGDAKTFQVHVKDMVLPALEKVIRYGIQRAVNDPIGGKNKTLADKLEAAEDIILSWYSGEFKARKNAAPKLSDEAAFIRSFTIAAIKAAFVTKHGKDSWKEKTDGESGAAFIAGLLEKHAARFESDAKAAWTAELAKRAASKALADSMDFDI